MTFHRAAEREIGGALENGGWLSLAVGGDCSCSIINVTVPPSCQQGIDFLDDDAIEAGRTISIPTFGLQNSRFILNSSQHSLTSLSLPI